MDATEAMSLNIQAMRNSFARSRLDIDSMDRDEARTALRVLSHQAEEAIVAFMEAERATLTK